MAGRPLSVRSATIVFRRKVFTPRPMTGTAEAAVCAMRPAGKGSCRWSRRSSYGAAAASIFSSSWPSPTRAVPLICETPAGRRLFWNVCVAACWLPADIRLP